MTDALQQTLLNAIPVVIGSLATAYITVRSANKKTEDSAKQTNQILETSTAETSKKLDSVHETVNGNFTALQSKNDAQAEEIIRLREQLAHANKRATDKP